MVENISVLIVNSSHASVDAIISILKTKILSEQRPYITCLSYDDFRDEVKNGSIESFFRKIIATKLDQSRKMLKKLQQRNEFNQLEFWKSDTKKKQLKNDSKNQSCMLKRDELHGIILDFPVENEIELYLILFCVYDCHAIKSLLDIFDELLMGIVNLYPRDLEKCEDVKNEHFWHELVQLKFKDRSFDKIAFVDLDVPSSVSCSQLIYDQFTHFIYDFELDVKRKYQEYLKCLVIHEVTEDAANVKDLMQLEKQLNEIPICMLSIERIYEALLETIAPLDACHSTLNKQSRKSFEIKAFGKTFRDMTDKWLCVCDENFKFYSNELFKLESFVYDAIWRSAETISLERRQILNYFMGKIAENLNEEATKHLEFYIYVLEFTRWQQQCREDKEFYENRSVGHAKKKVREHLRHISSDIHIDYKNLPRIPKEIEQLTNDKMELKGIHEGGDFYVQFYSRPSMLQRLKNLMSEDENFQRQHFTLFDVMLLKFVPSEKRKIFSTKSYTKTLPTPLCFRDFNDYGKRPSSMDYSLVNAIRHDEGDNVISSQYKPEDFLLETSIKRKLLERKSHESADSGGEMNGKKEQRDNLMDQPLKIEVYNATNKFTEYSVTESFFTSFHLRTTVQLYSWLNCEEHLNISCSLHDTRLTFSDDLRDGKFRNATLHDELTGMICSIDMNDGRKIVSTLPHGMRVSIVDGKSIEFDWMRLNEREDFSPIVADEGKRIFFSNGFVMVCLRSGKTKIYSPSGTIYEILSSPSKTNSSTSVNHELTRRHQFSITSIHFLATFIDISSYTMTIFPGNQYRVKNDSIVKEYELKLAVRELFSDEGTSMLFRDDGLKLLYTPFRTKCLYPDGTLIVTTYDQNLSSLIESEVTQKSIPILDEIWLSDAKNSSNNVLENVLESIESDYFLCMKRTYQFEQKFYGRIQFCDDNFSSELELYNGTRFELRRNCECILISLKNGIKLRLSEAELQFSDRFCCECCSSNKFSINISNSSIDCNSFKVLACACDIDGNLLEIQQCNGSRQVAFYDAWKHKPKCGRCSKMKEEFNMRHFSERWLILNRDMTGYEVFPQKPTSEKEAWIETNDTLLYRSSDAYEILIDDKDFDIDIECEMTTSSETSVTQVESISKRNSQQIFNEENVKRRKKKNGSSGTRRATKKEEEASVIEKLSPSPPWVTFDPSITSDISLEHRELIEFYANPLHELNETLDVGSILKLQRDNFINVTNALYRLKKYVDEKFIINSRSLMTSPLNKKSFDENFGFIVRKSLEVYVERKLEQFRCCMARAIIEDLLANAFNALEEEDAAAAETKVTHVIERETRGEIVVASAAVPIAVKSFSFV